MIKNFDIEIHHLNGEPIMDGEAPVLARTIIVNALMGQPKNENPSGEEKARRWELACRFNAGGNQEISPEDIVLIKRLVGEMYYPIIVGPVFKLLNQ